jgi:hypothetical protein
VGSAGSAPDSIGRHGTKKAEPGTRPIDGEVWSAWSRVCRLFLLEWSLPPAQDTRGGVLAYGCRPRWRCPCCRVHRYIGTYDVTGVLSLRIALAASCRTSAWHRDASSYCPLPMYRAPSYFRRRGGLACEIASSQAQANQRAALGTPPGPHGRHSCVPRGGGVSQPGPSRDLQWPSLGTADWQQDEQC